VSVGIVWCLARCVSEIDLIEQQKYGVIYVITSL
jgi:hypothetical protein